MQRKTLTVGLGSRAYDIIIGPGLIDDAAGQLGDIAKGRHIVIVSDANVAALHLDRLKAGLAPAAGKIDSFVVAAGEASKSMRVLAALLVDALPLLEPTNGEAASEVDRNLAFLPELQNADIRARVTEILRR